MSSHDPPVTDGDCTSGDNTPKSNYVQWGYNNGELYPTSKTYKTLPAGYYKPVWSDGARGPVLKLLQITYKEKIIPIPDTIFKEIIDDINVFWNKGEQYKLNGYPYKRGILLYGPVGCGKSTIISTLSKHLIKEHKGSVIYVSDLENLGYMIQITERMREYDSTKILIIIEDIDSFTEQSKSNLSTLLNFLDGGNKTENCVIMATTNNPDKLSENIACRPSRFARKFLIDLPNEEVREYYIKSFIPDQILKKFKLKISGIVDQTRGFTIDHLKELSIALNIQDKDYNSIMDEIRQSLDDPYIKSVTIKNSKESNAKKVGFK